MKFILTILFLLLFQSDYCQTGKQLHYNFRHIDHFDGLANNIVTWITQDKKGFMWIGTMNGLQRYDGTWFRTYRDPFLEEGGSYAGILKISWVGDELWVSSNDKIFKYNPLNNLFVKVDPNTFINKSYKYKEFTDEHKKQWFVGDYIVYSYDPAMKKINYEYATLDSGVSKKPGLLYDEVNQWYWSFYLNGGSIFDVKTKKAYSYAAILNEIFPKLINEHFTPIDIKSMLIDSDHNLWISMWGENFVRYNLITKKGSYYTVSKIVTNPKYKNNSTGPMFVETIFEDNHQNVWLGTYSKGLLRYNRKTDDFDYVILEKNNNSGLRYNYEIFTIFQDKQENIWVGTDAGISIFNPYNNLFKTVSPSDGAKDKTLPPQEISSLYQTRNKDIVVGTWGGGTTFFDSAFKFEKNHLFRNPRMNLVWSITDDSEGRIWAGCQAGFITRFYPDGSFLDTLRPKEMHNSTIRSIIKDKTGNIYFGLHNGTISKWSARENKFYDYNFGKNYSIKKSPVSNLFMDTHNKLWTCTGNGFFRFDLIKMVYVDSFFSDKKRKNSLKNNRPTAVQQLNDSTLMIGYLNGGGGYFNMNSKEFTSWDLNDDISSNTVTAIKEDEKGNIWFTTGFGLYNFTVGNEKNAVNFLMDKRIINSPFYTFSFTQLANGEWATASATELLIFDPKKLEEEKQKPFPVEITGFKIFENRIFIDSFLQYNAPLHLNHNQNNLTIEFAVLNYSSLTDLKFFYQLEGLDKVWIDAGHNHFAGYTNLSPGHYTFKVKSVNGNNESAISRLSIYISAPFWQTIWFQLLVLACVAFVVYKLVLRRIKVIRKESELKQKISETEMAALRAQMNPHFIFNCINAIDNLIQTGEKDNATTYLAMFARLIRNVLDSSKNNIIPFQRDLESIKLYIELEQFRCSNKFSYTIDTDADLLNGDYKVPPLIIQPFIENAIHHGLLNKESGSGQLSISISLKEDYIKYTIIDNGVGRERAAALNLINKPEHLSYGIAISTERLDRYNEDFDSIQIIDLYENSLPAGTKVEINIKADESKVANV